MRAALERYRPVLAQLGASSTARSCSTPAAQVDDLPAALAAIDLALWDRAGRRAGKPIAALLTDEPAPQRAGQRDDRRARPRRRRRAGGASGRATGFDCLKLKVGVGDDAGRVAAVRAAAGPEVALRLDANGAWSVERGGARDRGAGAAPASSWSRSRCTGCAAVRAVRERVAVRVAIDETAAEHGALGAGVADAVCLKISRCGGICGLIAAATLVRASGAEAYLASTLDGPLGVAAGGARRGRARLARRGAALRPGDARAVRGI